MGERKGLSVYLQRIRYLLSGVSETSKLHCDTPVLASTLTS